MIKQTNIFDRFLQNAARPRGFWGRIGLRMMNVVHALGARWAIGKIDWQAEWNVLDIGCGGGANITRMLRLCPRGNVYGIDVSEESASFAQKHNKRWLGKRCFISHGDVHRLPYDDGLFDVVTAFETIYFWQDLPAAFNEVARVLRHDGRFLIECDTSDPYNDVWTSRIENMRVYSPTELETLLRDVGFAEIVIHRRGKEALCVVACKA